MGSRISAKDTLELLLGHLGLVFEIREEQRPMGPTLHILTSDPGRLIGRNGKVLDDLQYLLNRIVHQSDDDDSGRILVDVESYRLQRYQEMMDEVDKIAAKVAEDGQEATLPPMNSFERRLVHNHFKDHPGIKSVSPQTDSKIKSIILCRRS